MFEKCGIPCNIIFSCLFSNYKSSTEEDHGQVLCWASNGLGEQIQPCVFRVVPLASPAPPKDCRVRSFKKYLVNGHLTFLKITNC